MLLLQQIGDWNNTFVEDKGLRMMLQPVWERTTEKSRADFMKEGKTKAVTKVDAVSRR